MEVRINQLNVNFNSESQISEAHYTQGSRLLGLRVERIRGIIDEIAHGKKCQGEPSIG